MWPCSLPGVVVGGGCGWEPADTWGLFRASRGHGLVASGVGGGVVLWVEGWFGVPRSGGRAATRAPPRPAAPPPPPPGEASCEVSWEVHLRLCSRLRLARRSPPPPVALRGRGGMRAGGGLVLVGVGGSVSDAPAFGVPRAPSAPTWRGRGACGRRRCRAPRRRLGGTARPRRRDARAPAPPREGCHLVI